MDAVEIIGPVAGLAVGAACGWLLARRQQAPVAEAGASAPAVDSPPVRDPAPEQDRDRLVAVCIDVGDRLRTSSPALWHKLARGLAEAGIEPITVDGAAFDPDQHDAVGTEPTDDPAKDLRVVTDLPGYADRGSLLRRPQVVVYRLNGGGA